MSEMSFEQMLDESFKTIHNGEVVEGTVIDVKEDEIILNIGCKADGIITKSEFTGDSSADLRELVHVDDVLQAKVYKVNDKIVLRLCVRRAKAAYSCINACMDY